MPGIFVGVLFFVAGVLTVILIYGMWEAVKAESNARRIFIERMSQLSGPLPELKRLSEEKERLEKVSFIKLKGVDKMKNQCKIKEIRLKDTAGFMKSKNYIKRFIAEYWQLKIRYKKLEVTVARYDWGMLDFKLACPIYILREQLRVMREYMELLKLRAEKEGISLEWSAGHEKKRINED